MPPDVEAIAEQVFSALADPTRRAILATLAAQGPATATDLADRLPITRQAIAKHLVLLADAGLVTPEPGERRRVRYRLHSAPVQVAQQFLAALAHDWDDRLEALRDHLDRSAPVLTTTNPANRNERNHCNDTALSKLSATPADYQTTIRVKASPDALFDALTTVTGLAAWWNPATGSGETGGELRFIMNAPEPLVIHVDEATRPTSVRWTVTDCPFLPDWIGTRPTFTITPVDGDTSELHFRHQGLSEELECIDMCTRSWDHYMTSLRDYLEVGRGSPFGSPADRARRDAHKRKERRCPSIRSRSSPHHLSRCSSCSPPAACSVPPLGMPAEITDREGDPFSLFGGRVEGRQIELVPGQRVVQAWRFGAAHPSPWEPGVYSTVRFTLEPAGDGTRLVIDHAGIPAEWIEHISRGLPGLLPGPIAKFFAN